MTQQHIKILEAYVLKPFFLFQRLKDVAGEAYYPLLEDE